MFINFTESALTGLGTLSEDAIIGPLCFRTCSLLTNSFYLGASLNNFSQIKLMIHIKIVDLILFNTGVFDQVQVSTLIKEVSILKI